MDNLNKIFDRPPQIGDDTVQYAIHLPPSSNSKADAETAAALIHSCVGQFLPNHIWNRDSFELKPVRDLDSPSEWTLDGTMRVGDSVDDEWLVVWLLRQISAKWDVIASIYDTDGDFLLIEAAEHLPSWINPSNAENRVWIYKSKLQLVPLSYNSPSVNKPRRRKLPGARESDDEWNTPSTTADNGFISTVDALKVVRDAKSTTEASEAIQTAAWRRTEGYPSAARQHIHFTTAFLPVDIAKALSVNPDLVQKATEAFYTRDAMQLRSIHRMARFPPSPSVLDTIKMTRTAYAQLLGQNFHQPKAFGTWTEPTNSKEWRWRDVGMKIACGFEMLYQESKGKASALKGDSAMDGLRDTLSRDKDYIQYIDNLKKFGYFGTEVTGSAEWQKRDAKATKLFVDMHRDDDASRTSFASAVNSALAACTTEKYCGLLKEEDSDEWLNVDAQDLDDLLEKTRNANSDAKDAKEAVPEAEEREANNQASKLKDLAVKVQDFVEGEGSLDGAKFQNEADSDDEDEDLELGELSDGLNSSGSEADTDIEMDSSNRQAAMDSLVPALEPSEYGKMPASYYSNSQPVLAEKSTADARTDDEGPAQLGATAPELSHRSFLARDRYDGVDSDDETDSEGERMDGTALPNEEEELDSEDERPQVVGDVEIDMGEEQEDFLKFSREALGITDDMWSSIVKEREGRGAFVPSQNTSRPQQEVKSPPAVFSNGYEGEIPRNPNLSSFEAVMEAMEAELAATKGAKAAEAKTPLAPTTSKGKGKACQTNIDSDGDTDMQAEMDEELKAALARDDEEEESDGADEVATANVDYNLIKNFLESFKSQGGLSGPVSNLAGQLQPGWQIPRDNT